MRAKRPVGLSRPLGRSVLRSPFRPPFDAPTGGSSLRDQVIAALFSSGEQGVLIDPSDLSTLYQDSAGTTPVTTVAQPVGLVLDKSGRGNHLTQATAASRPVTGRTVAGGRRNLLLDTDALATQSVAVAAVAHTLSFTGTGTVVLSGASTAGPLVGTGAGDRVDLTFTPTASSLTLTVTGSVAFAQLELGSAATAYQRVGTTDLDVTEAGKEELWYLRGDGVDDMLNSAPGVFGTETKMALFAASENNRVDAAMIVLGVSNNGYSSSDKWMALGSPSTSFPNTGIGTAVKGDAGNRSSVMGTADTERRILASIFTGSQVVVRVDGVESAVSTTNTSVELTDTIDVFAGANPTLPILEFDGQIFGAIVVNAAPPDETKTLIDQWLASKAGVTLP